MAVSLRAIHRAGFLLIHSGAASRDSPVSPARGVTRGDQTMGNAPVKVQQRHDERGMTTAEYAVGTVASVSIVSVLIAIINNPEFQRVLWELVQLVFKVVMQMFAGS